MYPPLLKYKKHLTIAYVFLLLFGSIFVYKTLQEKEVKVADKESKTTEIEVKPVVVYLNVQGSYGLLTNSYRARRQNTDTILDFFEHLRTNQDFWYEKTAYTYGTELDNINHVKAPKDYSWRVYLNDEDITYQLATKALEDDTTYILKLEPTATHTSTL